MSEKEYTSEELEELDKYLSNEFNHDIYEELIGEGYTSYDFLFEPLEFFRLFYSQIEFIESNKDKPLFVARNLKKLDFTNEQLDCLFAQIEAYFEETKESDKQINICCREISKLRENLGIEKPIEEENEEVNNLYRFKNVLAHLETLPSYREKIAYLIEEKTKYEQDNGAWLLSWSMNFDNQCELEINKLQNLARLEAKPKPQIIEIGKHKDLTIDRVIFLFNRLIPEFEDFDATKKAKFINFLTGFDYETVRQRFSSIYRKEADKPQAFKKDMEMICKYLDELGLNEIVSEIKNDLDFS